MSASKSIDYIIGVDQTGAIKSSGKPKALPACILKVEKRNNKFIENKSKGLGFNLQSLERDKLISFLKEIGVDFQASKILVAVDSVLGLPKSFSKTKNPKKYLYEKFQDAGSTAFYGFKEAEKYFNTLLKKKYESLDEHPRRKVETQLNANSVFRSRPFQKNIQTGTFRIWKDLSSYAFNEFLLWPHDLIVFEKGIPVFVEAYPSLAWKILNKSNRKSENFKHLFKKMNDVSNIKKVQFLGGDHKDAALSCLLALYLVRDYPKWLSKKSSNIEGDIMGSFLING